MLLKLLQACTGVRICCSRHFLASPQVEIPENIRQTIKILSLGILGPVCIGHIIPHLLVFPLILFICWCSFVDWICEMKPFNLIFSQFRKSGNTTHIWLNVSTLNWKSVFFFLHLKSDILVYRTRITKIYHFFFFFFNNSPAALYHT